MYKIINAAMVPNEGTFRYRLISRDQARQWLGANLSECLSTHGDFIGYQQTADHLNSMFGEYCSSRGGGQPTIRVPLRRVKCSMQPGDEALVCKLAYRVDNPATKGQPQPEDWEYGLLRFVVPSFGYVGASGVLYHCQTCANSMGEQCDARTT